MISGSDGGNRGSAVRTISVRPESGWSAQRTLQNKGCYVLRPPAGHRIPRVRKFSMGLAISPPGRFPAFDRATSPDSIADEPRFSSPCPSFPPCRHGVTTENLHKEGKRNRRRSVQDTRRPGGGSRARFASESGNRAGRGKAVQRASAFHVARGLPGTAFPSVRLNTYRDDPRLGEITPDSPDPKTA